MFSHASRPPAIQRATLFSNSMRATPPYGALRLVERVLADEAKKPKPGSRDSPTYLAILYRRDGVVVRASASQSVDLGFISLVESYQKTLKNGIHSFPAWRSA